jgi:hypothetical protein
VAMGGISPGMVYVWGWSRDESLVRGSGGKNFLVDVVRLGASEIIPQP